VQIPEVSFGVQIVLGPQYDKGEHIFEEVQAVPSVTLLQSPLVQVKPVMQFEVTMQESPRAPLTHTPPTQEPVPQAGVVTVGSLLQD